MTPFSLVHPLTGATLLGALLLAPGRAVAQPAPPTTGMLTHLTQPIDARLVDRSRCPVPTVTLGWDRVGLEPAVAERSAETPAIGPDIVAAGPNGLVALYDPVHLSIEVLTNMKPTRSIPKGRLDGLAFTAGGRLLATDDQSRSIAVIDPVAGTTVQEFHLPDLVPPGATIVVDGDDVWAEDPFGNRHPVARVTNGRLAPAATTRIQAPRHALGLQTGSSGATVIVDGQRVVIPGAVTASSEIIGGEPPWVAIDAVIGGPASRGLLVKRYLLPPGTTTPIELPPGTPLYQPSQPYAVGPDGRLVALRPTSAGLTVLCAASAGNNRTRPEPAPAPAPAAPAPAPAPQPTLTAPIRIPITHVPAVVAPAPAPAPAPEPPPEPIR